VKAVPKVNPTSQAKAILIEEHLGIVAGRALRYWQLLPDNVKAYYDPDDMVMDVVTHIVRYAARKYDPQRKYCPSTFVWWVADNQCKTLLTKYSSRKYQTVELPDEEEMPQFFSNAETLVRLREAMVRVERVLKGAVGTPLALYLDNLLYGHPLWKWPPPICMQFLDLSHRCRVGYEDFRLILAGA